MPTQFEEAILNANLIDAQQLLPDFGYLLLALIAGSPIGTPQDGAWITRLRTPQPFGFFKNVGDGVSFAAVDVLAERSAMQMAQASTAALELVLANGRTVRVGAGFDAATLQRLLPLVEDLPPC